MPNTSITINKGVQRTSSVTVLLDNNRKVAQASFIIQRVNVPNINYKVFDTHFENLPNSSTITVNYTIHDLGQYTAFFSYSLDDGLSYTSDPININVVLDVGGDPDGQISSRDQKLIDTLTHISSFMNYNIRFTREDYQKSPEYNNLINTFNNIKRVVLGRQITDFNMREIHLPPNIDDNRIQVPTEALRVQVVGEQAKRYVARQGYFFDLNNQSFYIDEPIKVIVWEDLDFVYIPFHLQEYIKWECIRSMYPSSDNFNQKTFSEVIYQYRRAVTEYQNWANGGKRKTSDDEEYFENRFYRNNYIGDKYL